MWYLLDQTRPMTPFDVYGHALNAITPRGVEVYGRGRWWPWFRPRPFTNTNLACSLGRPPEEEEWLARAVRCTAPHREQDLWLDGVPADVPSTALGDLHLREKVWQDWDGRDELGTVVGFPYGSYQIFAPRRLDRPRIRPEPITLVFFRYRCFRLRPFSDAQRPIFWLTPDGSSAVRWTPGKGPGRGMLRLRRDSEALWADRLTGVGARVPSGFVSVRMQVQVRGAIVHYGFTRDGAWVEPALPLIHAERPYTIAGVCYVDRTGALPFTLWAQPDSGTEGPASVEILNAEFLAAEPIDPTYLGPGALLAPAWQEIPPTPHRVSTKAHPAATELRGRGTREREPSMSETGLPQNAMRPPDNPGIRLTTRKE